MSDLSSTSREMDLRSVNVIKGLIMDTVRKANSGHPGGAMSSSDFAYILYKEFLRFDPDNAEWWNRDRFVLSAGHESALLYSLLTLSGSLSVDDLKGFRQYESRTPGHPEHDMTPGVEATTGPLGQGFAMAGGMAVAESFLNTRLGADITDHTTYVLASDGDMQEPVSLGSAALFGQWGLGKLVVYYDSNEIQLAGPTRNVDCADYKKAFESFCWHVIEINGHDHDQIREALTEAKSVTDRPTLIIGHTTMAKGSATLEGSEATHGAPFSPEEITATKTNLGLPAEKQFYLPEDVLTHFQARFNDLRAEAAAWNTRLQTKLAESPSFAATWNELSLPPAERSLTWPEFKPGTSVATRKAFGACLNALMDQLPNLMGGSADLDPSNQTATFRDTVGVFNARTNPLGRNLCFGVREFPMGAIANGMALHGGVIPFGATFLVFSDYERNAIRMSALQKLPVLHVFTHDSFFVGEDGPTHQPVEHVSSLRLIPNLLVLRPGDAVESAACMDIALRQTDRPSVLIFTRQGLPVTDTVSGSEVVAGTARGGYIVREAEGGDPDTILLASGSEVHLAIETAALLTERRVRVVSMPSMELFEEQDQAYKDQVLPPHIRARVAVEAGRPEMWYRYTGLDGAVHGMTTFGASAPASVLKEEYGFTPEKLAKFVEEGLRKKG